MKVISIRLKEEEELYRQFNQAKEKYDMERKEKGEKETSYAEFVRKLLYSALKGDEG